MDADFFKPDIPYPVYTEASVAILIYEYEPWKRLSVRLST